MPDDKHVCPRCHQDTTSPPRPAGEVVGKELLGALCESLFKHSRPHISMLSIAVDSCLHEEVNPDELVELVKHYIETHRLENAL